ncbi:response regulator transcription factor [Alicyclobacillus macrosporangiidus]|uniref:Two-component system, OmpR family, alkaline phosphatase synthesis response regulator PhoP n=1 Tax=Alicyclobacillus macrosporangiidus TaxID=392015 RepID=A0A1I7F865_9BACL|nr:response regulator transcription factor [Alicyclobacillus macrosporangiidus]SFU32360.1 two-component system, OmpR family, alkaline phosphatase synthesis response regulator PhoP [Alicyclobacillus macrosporangiidus]
MDAGGKPPKVLIVDDEESIQQLVAYNFRSAGFDTEIVGNGRDAYERMRADDGTVALVILDISLPGMDGMEVCKHLRQEHVWTPIILLTARDDELDRVLGLELGADDYVTKPFSPRELVARARAVLRRVEDRRDDAPDAGPMDDCVSAGDIVLCVSRHEVTVSGRPVELTPKEFELLRYLILHQDHVLAREQLLQQVWGYAYTPDTRIVDVHISHLRDKIEPNPKHPVYIRTVRGVGYRFTGGFRPRRES